jgi:hypothetical protein
MLSWLARRCENAEWIAVEAETLIRDLGVTLKVAWFLGHRIREGAPAHIVDSLPLKPPHHARLEPGQVQRYQSHRSGGNRPPSRPSRTAPETDGRSGALAR